MIILTPERIYLLGLISFSLLAHVKALPLKRDLEELRIMAATTPELRLWDTGPVDESVQDVRLVFGRLCAVESTF